MEPLLGALIRKERLKQNFSQEGLCKGICVVSYLSKIEKGRADASQEIISALLERLGIVYEADPDFLKHAGELVEQLYEKMYNYALQGEDLEEIQREWERYLSSKYMLDAMLLLRGGQNLPPEAEQGNPSMPFSELEEYVPYMAQRQYELYLYYLCWEGREPFEKLLKLNPNSFYLTQAGTWHWAKGEYIQAIELLSKGYGAASEEGGIFNMLMAKTILGNCYASLGGSGNQELMMKNYKVAERIAKAIGAEEWVGDIYYNIASASLEWNQIDRAESYFQKCSKRGALYYHKYAICKERLGKKGEALKMLELGRKCREFTEPDSELFFRVQERENDCMMEASLFEEMYDVAEYRLCHEGYRRDPEYERILRECMRHMGEHLPKSYLKFHVPFLVEVLEQQRKYKEICELMREFSV